MSSIADNWKWNIWEMDRKTGKRKRWIGSITDPKTGFSWIKAQGKDASLFRINNVPPTTSTMQNPSREVYAEQDLQVKVGDRLPQRHIPGKYDNYTPRRDRRKAKQPVASSPYSGVQYGKNVAPKVAKPKTKAEKKLAEDAARLLNQHKADEQAEMDAANND